MSKGQTRAIMVGDHQRVGHIQMVELLQELRTLLANVESGARELYEQWRPWLERRAFIPGAWNFSAYLALRRPDMRALQTALCRLDFRRSVAARAACDQTLRPSSKRSLRDAAKMRIVR